MDIVNELKKLNNKAIKNGDIPVSAIIMHENKIISRAYNKKIKNNDPIAHAEILAIRKAAKVLKSPNLIDCELYVTLMPCPMCINVINESRIKKVYYFANSYKIVNNTISFNKMNDDNGYFSKELSTFFVDKR